MSLPTATREEVREQIAADLEEVLVDVEAVYAYQASNFEQRSPIVRVLSDGALLAAQSLEAYGLTYFFVLQVWVVRYNVASGWTEAEAEALLDAINATILAYIADDPTGKPWDDMSMTDRSTVNVGGNEVAGELFLVEDFPIKVEIWATD